jgi:diacylglycerol kinase (ATP)
MPARIIRYIKQKVKVFNVPPAARNLFEKPHCVGGHLQGKDGVLCLASSIASKDIFFRRTAGAPGCRRQWLFDLYCRLWYNKCMTDDTKTLLLLNPAAGKGKGKKQFNAVRSALENKFKNLEVKVSEYPGHMVEISRNAVENGFQRIISIGGDGTPFEIINGIYAHGKLAHEIELGMIPAGTGNSFLRDFDSASPGIWVENILKGKTRKVDVVEFTYHKEGKPVKSYYINIMGIGLIADILKLTNEKLKFLGSLGYSAAVLVRLFKGMNNRMTVTVDNEAFELKNSALVISNSRYTGGKMKIAPMADTGDGKVDMVVFNEVNRREIIDIFIKVFKGAHVDHPKVKVFSGSEMGVDAEPRQLIMADGELLGETPMTLKVLPGQLKILT